MEKKNKINFPLNNLYCFILLDSKNLLIGSLQNNSKTINYKVKISIPSIRGRGGSSYMRFARIRAEKFFGLFKLIIEKISYYFIIEDKIKINGIIIAGTEEIIKKISNLFKLNTTSNPILKYIILYIILPFGGESGFNKAIDIFNLNYC